MKTVLDPVREVKVCREADVVVVGGGPGGIGSAVAAARNGAKTVLIERYGCLGGMATGGLVNIIPNLSEISGKQYIFGLTQELIDRLNARGGTSYPRKEDWGTTDRNIVDYYLDANFGWFFIRKDLNIGKERVLYSVVVDPEILKDELNDLISEAGINLLLHSWGTQPIMEGNTLKGIIFESKSGRQAVLGKVVIDSTGDGDILTAAGADFDGKLDPKLRTAWLAIVFWLANVDLRKTDDFKKTQPEKYAELMRELKGIGGQPSYFKGLLKNQENCVWFHFFQPNADGTSSDAKNVEELTRVDVNARKRALITYDFFRTHIPGFEKSFIMLTAPQLGIQGGRRLVGEYMLTEKDMESDEIFDDTIAVFPNNDNGEISAKHPVMCIPYRTMVPKTNIENLLVACRAYSTSDSINHHFNIIPFCLSLGQAAGTAAALAVKEGKIVRNINYKVLQDNLRRQGVFLPSEL